MNAAHDIKLGISSVRGVVGEAFTPELVIRFARAFGTWVEGAPVVLGRDTRRSSPMFHAAAVSGLLSAGCELLDLDVSSTPLAAFAVRAAGAGGGMVITGSHNDDAWNALKFIGPDGALLNVVRSEELLDIFHASAFRAGGGLAHIRRSGTAFTDRYAEHLASLVDVDAVRRAGFHAVLDVHDRPAAGPAARLLDAIGVAHTTVDAGPDGAALCAAVRDSGADLGALVNMDGDRVTFVTGDGALLSSEMSLPLLARQRLRRRPGPVVTNHSTSSRVEAVAADFGQPVIRTPVGESYVVDGGLEAGAVLAGEGSGGVAALPGTVTFDALLSIALLLDLMADEENTLAEQAAALPVRHMRKQAVRCAPADAYRAMERLRKACPDPDADFRDGIRTVDAGGNWLHLRVSNTEPVIRVIAEAAEAGDADRMQRTALAQVRAALEGGPA